MTGYNRIIVAGNLTRDPEYKQLASGQGVSQLGVAINRQYKNKQTGSMVQEVCFVDVDVYGPQAESCRQYLQKGRSVLIEGRLRFDSWETPDGQKRSKHTVVADRVVFLGSSSSDATTQDKSNGARPSHSSGYQASSKDSDDSQSYESSSTHQNNTDDDSGTMAFNDEPPFQDDLPF